MGATWPDFRAVSVRLAVMSPALASQLRLQQIEPPLSGEGSAVGRGGAGDQEGARPGLSVASPSWNLQGHGEIQLGFPRA